MKHINNLGSAINRNPKIIEVIQNKIMMISSVVNIFNFECKNNDPRIRFSINI